MPKKYVRRMSTKKSGAKNSHKTTPEFRKKVLTVVKRTQELKICMMEDQNNSSITLYNSAVPTPPTVIDLDQLISAQIQQGTGETQRIGDKIYPSKVLYEGFLVARTIPTETTPIPCAPCYMRMIILKDKLNQSVNNWGDLFETSTTGISAAPTNTLLDITRRVNGDRYTVYTQRVFKLGNASSYDTRQPVIGTNNDFKVSKFFKVDLTKHMKKIDFDTAGLTSPSNLQVIFVGAYADNSAITFTVYNGPPVNITSTLRISYRDA